VSTRKRWAWLALLTCSLVWLGLIVERNAARGRFTRAFSTYGSGPEGTRALYLMLGELGFRTARWSQDLARVPDRATLIALGSCEDAAVRALSRYEREDLVAWVERGGLLVVAGARNYLPRALGVGFEDDRRCKQREEESAAAREPFTDADELLAALSDIQPAADSDADRAVLAVPLGAALKGLPLVSFQKPANLVSDAELRFESLLVAPDVEAPLRPLALTYTRGRGRVIVLSAANMFQNAELIEAEGAPLVARLLRAYAPGSLLIFDEYHLGLGERRSLMQYLRQVGIYPLLAQLLLGAGIALWRAGARLGAPRGASEPEDPAVHAGVVSALGRMYARTADRRGAVRVIARGALLRIAEHYALGSMPATALERELRRRGAGHAADCVQRIAELGRQGAGALVQSAARIDEACAAALAAPRT
jgi:hypothetical protein